MSIPPTLQWSMAHFIFTLPDAIPAGQSTTSKHQRQFSIPQESVFTSLNNYYVTALTSTASSISLATSSTQFDGRVSRLWKD